MRASSSEPRWSLLVALVLVAGVLAGCASAPTREAAPQGTSPPLAVIGADRLTFTAQSPDSTMLSAVAYVPQTNGAAPDGLAPHWPLIVFLHGWGGSKADYEGNNKASTVTPATDGTNLLRRFALDGFVVVAYDARGFGQSGGQATVAGPAERADLDAVILESRARFALTEEVGVVGQSYGGGQALNAWAGDPLVTAVVAQYGWTDLYDALLPGNVPKLEWGNFLYAYGIPGSSGRYSDNVNRWYTDGQTRVDLDTIHVEMQARSILNRGSTKPLYLCQGMQETLFPQIDLARAAANASGAFVRASVFQGGHGADWDQCWSNTESWFAFFLAGRDTHVDAWPVLSTVDALQPGISNYTTQPKTDSETRYFRLGELVTTPSQTSFQVVQTFMSNPLADPSGISDQSGQPAAGLPDPLRTDPTAATFTSAPIDDTRTLFGAATLTLLPANSTGEYQVTAQLQAISPDGTSRVIGHAAWSGAGVAGNATNPDGSITLRFPWIQATFQKGDKLRVVVAANDASWFLPLDGFYTVNFAGQHHLDVPWMVEQPRAGV